MGTETFLRATLNYSQEKGCAGFCSCVPAGVGDAAAYCECRRYPRPALHTLFVGELSREIYLEKPLGRAFVHRRARPCTCIQPRTHPACVRALEPNRSVDDRMDASLWSDETLRRFPLWNEYTVTDRSSRGIAEPSEKYPSGGERPNELEDLVARTTPRETTAVVCRSLSISRQSTRR